MGDIINSTPTVIEYPLTLASAFPVLATQKAAAGTATAHFRVIYVATNQGHVHAFGEVSFTTTKTVVDPVSGLSSTVSLPSAAVVELWSFIPTEAILAPWYLDNMTYAGATNTLPNPHVYLADGSPYIYFDDKAVSVTSSVGNGIVDGNDVALLIFGLGKGGRSYYCLNIGDPTTPLVPKYKWVIRPDDVAATGGNQTVRTMGLATCKPTTARAVGTDGKVADFVMLGGGFSNADIENNVGWVSTDPPRPFGHSVIMFDVNKGPGNYLTGTGTITSWTDSLMGSVPAGVMPFEFYTGSYMTQRVYFTDRGGGVWALGVRSNTSGNRDPDSSLVSTWLLRPVFHTDNTTVISTLPEVFSLPNGVIPQTGTPAVGVAFGTGDRNNPMDFPALSAGVIPGAISGGSYNRMCLVFDTNLPSNDSSGIPETSLANLTTVNTEAAALPATYLQVGSDGKPLKFGYYLLLNGATSPFYDKMINEPLVLNSVLFFSVFTPTNDSTQPCSGAGVTNTFREGLVWSPLFNSGNRTTTSDYTNSSWSASSGKVAGASFINLASDPGAIGNTQVVQAGQDSTVVKGKSGTIIKQMQGKGVPVGMRMRSWRIIR
jgi:Tfp pilus tip-associated adhesin PilY1